MNTIIIIITRATTPPIIKVLFPAGGDPVVFSGSVNWVAIVASGGILIELKSRVISSTA